MRYYNAVSDSAMEKQGGRMKDERKDERSSTNLSSFRLALLLPAKYLERDDEAHYAPGEQDADSYPARYERCSVVHHCAQRIVERGERQRFDERLQKIREARRRKECA